MRPHSAVTLAQLRGMHGPASSTDASGSPTSFDDAASVGTLASTPPSTGALLGWYEPKS
jgi:hypothetical protein